MARRRKKTSGPGMNPVGSVVLIIALMTAVVWFPATSRMRATSDRADAPVQHGTATVMGTTLNQGTTGNLDPSHIVSLRLNGQVVTARTYQVPPTGSVVSVNYRIGKSGAIYVQGIGPPPPRPSGTLTIAP